MIKREIFREMPHLRRLYSEGRNIMQYFREKEESFENSPDAILVSYDLQTGSYIEALKDPDVRAYHNLYCSKLAQALNGLSPGSLLEAGVGEATTLSGTFSLLPEKPREIAGFDISWSRAFYAQNYFSTVCQAPANLFVGDLFSIPLCDNSYEVVFTSHTVSSNTGREREALAELFRVARRYVLLLEPSYEFGDQASRENMDRHRYCRDLRAIAQELGFAVKDYRLFDNNWPASDMELLLIEKQGTEPVGTFACPISLTPLVEHAGQFFCKDCGLVFPVVGGIPCLLDSSAILATKFLELSRDGFPASRKP